MKCTCCCVHFITYLLLFCWIYLFFWFVPCFWFANLSFEIFLLKWRCLSKATWNAPNRFTLKAKTSISYRSTDSLLLKWYRDSRNKHPVCKSQQQWDTISRFRCLCFPMKGNANTVHKFISHCPLQTRPSSWPPFATLTTLTNNYTKFHHRIRHFNEVDTGGRNRYYFFNTYRCVSLPQNHRDTLYAMWPWSALYPIHLYPLFCPSRVSRVVSSSVANLYFSVLLLQP